ncbi:MAG: hypothetical protein ACRC9H_14925 [Aeromonas veronii]
MYKQINLDMELGTWLGITDRKILDNELCLCDGEICDFIELVDLDELEDYDFEN